MVASLIEEGLQALALRGKPMTKKYEPSTEHVHTSHARHHFAACNSAPVSSCAPSASRSSLCMTMTVALQVSMSVWYRTACTMSAHAWPGIHIMVQQTC